MPTGPRAAEQKIANQPKNCCNPDGIVQAQKPAIIKEIAEAFGSLADGIGIIIVVGNLGNAAGNGHGSQCGNERRQLTAGNQLPIDDPYHKTASQSSKSGYPGIHSIGHHGGGKHATHSHHGTNGKINVSGNQNKGLPDTDNEDRRYLAQQISHIPAGKEGWVENAEYNAQYHKAYGHCDHLAHAAYRRNPVQGISFLCSFHVFHAPSDV